MSQIMTASREGWENLQPGMDTNSALEIKLVSLTVLMFTTLLCGSVVLCIIRGRGRCNTDLETRRKGLSLVSCFAGGVFLATCLLDLVPDYLADINRAFTNVGIKLQFPLPEFILAMGFFLILVMEQIVLVFRDKSGSFVSERKALLVDSSIQFRNGDGLGWNNIHSQHGYPREDPARPGDAGREGMHLHVDFNSHSAIRSFILVFSLSLHSMFEGLAVGLQRGGRQVLEICVALLLHKSVVSFSLALKLTQGRLRQAVVVGCLLIFSVMSPLGIGLGIAFTESSPQHQVACATLEGIAGGTFIYITFMEILPHELGSPENRVLKVAMLLTGFAVVTAVLFIKI